MYYAIMYPLSFRWTRKRGPLVILCIWIVAALLSSVQFVHGRATEFTWAGGTYYDCNENWEESSGKVYTAVIFTVTFMTPMLILTFTYTCIAWKMWRHTSPGNADVQRDQQQLNAKMKVVKMLATVVLMFAVCWLPIHLLNLILYFDREAIFPSTDTGEYLYYAAFFSCHWFSMANSFVNPIIYCFMSDNFSADLKQLVRGCCPSFQTKNGKRRALTKHNSFGGSSVRFSTSLNNMTSVSASRYCNVSATSSCSVVPLNAIGHPPAIGARIMFIC
ncbi:RYamide receptor-like isoform X1 [Ornithodoros turicata]|uniref:RYamide receptor-like isoform X1 n=1 Tax=Ornithodoros turicata TaxID=34597 RepID=UPI003138A8B4